MRRDSLRAFFDTSPTIKLLRSDYAPWVVEFLHRLFKSGERISVGQLDLRVQLAAYQEELHELDPGQLPGAPEQYLNRWVEQGWLHRFFEATAVEPQYQLTRYAEDALHFVDSTLTKGASLVGTESRLRVVIESLEDIVRGASADPQRRLDYLRAQRTQIDAEIVALETGKSVQVYQPAQIRDKFQTAVELLKQLQSDFRAVEERFQRIVRDVQQKQSAGQETRGGILGFALDAEDILKKEDEGLSFFAFVAFLFSPTQQAALRNTIHEVQQLAPLVDQHESLARLRRMVPALLAEADKVMKTTMRLSATLRRLLDAQTSAQRRRLASVLDEIKQTALQLRSNPPTEIELSVTSAPQLASPTTRPFWKPGTVFDNEQPAEHEVDLEKLQYVTRSFAKLSRLDFRKLRGRVREATGDGQSVTLASLFAEEPVRGGVVELLGLLQIAHEDHHRIDHSTSETLIVQPADERQPPLRVQLPRIVFSPKARTSSGSGKPK